MAKYKFMGSSDERRFNKGEDFSGRLATPLPRAVSFNWGNDHVVDSEDPDNADLPAEFWELLAKERGIEDVSSDKIVRLNDAQRLWQSLDDGKREGPRVSSSSMGQFPTVINDPPADPAR